MPPPRGLAPTKNPSGRKEDLLQSGLMSGPREQLTHYFGGNIHIYILPINIIFIYNSGSNNLFLYKFSNTLYF